MYSFKVNLEIITPLFSSGNDTRKAEFRVPELKYLLRRTFREFYKFKSLDELKELELLLFGGITDSVKSERSRKSPVSIRLNEVVNINKELDKKNNKDILVPHKNFKGNSIKIGKIISVVFQSYNKELIQIYSELLLLASYFGSLGKRSRKGMGSFRIKLFDSDVLDYKLDLIDKVLECKNNEIKVFKDRIISKNDKEYKIIMNTWIIEKNDNGFKIDIKNEKSIGISYARKIYIKKVKSDFGDLLCHISEMTHKRLCRKDVKNLIHINDEEKLEDIMSVLGENRNSKDKFASSIWASLAQTEEKSYFVIKELNYDYLDILKDEIGDIHRTYVKWYIKELMKNE